MNKIIKIALIASLIALFGCSAEGDPTGSRIANNDVKNPAGNNPSAGIDSLLNELLDKEPSSHSSSKSGSIDNVCDNHFKICTDIYACDDGEIYSCKSSSCSKISESSAMSACGIEY